MIRAHRNAVVQRLTSAGLTVYTPGEAPEGSSGYVVVYTDTGRGEQSRETDAAQSRKTFTYLIHWVGESEEQALWLAEKGIAALVGWPPTVAGRTCFPMKHEASQRVSPDPDFPTLWFGVDEFDLISIP